MEPILETLLADLVLIQGYLDVEGRSEPDEMRGVHAQSMIRQARHNMLARLRELSTLSPARLRMSLAAFKDTVTDLMLTGLSRTKIAFDTPNTLAFLNHGSLSSTFGGSGTRYIYEFQQPLDVLTAQSLSGDQLHFLLFSDVKQSAENDDNYSYKLTFDHQVFMKVVALLYAIESAGGRFGQDEDGGEETEAPVPRVPTAPKLSGEAEESIPEVVEEPIDAVWVTQAGFQSSRP
jgi:hypothetical protein